MPIESIMLSNHLILCHPLFLLPSIFPASGSIPMSWLFPSGGLRIETSASVLPIDIQGWFPLELTGLMSCTPRDSQESSPAPQFKSINSLTLSLLYDPALTIWTFVSKVLSLLFNTLSRFVIAFLPRSKCLNFMAAVPIGSDLGAQENKICHYVHFLSFYLPWSDGIACHDLSFLTAEFQASFFTLLSRGSYFLFIFCF